MADESERIQPATPPGDARPPEAAAPTHTLADVAKECALFTPALIVTHGHFDRDPVAEYNAHHPTDDPDVAPFILDATDFQFFQGLGKTMLGGQLVDWDRRLYGIRKDMWDQCRGFIGAISMYEPRRYHYARVMYHDLIIVDPVKLRSGKVLEDLPTVMITVFGVSGNRECVFLQPALDPPRTYPNPKLVAPDANVVREAEAILGPPPDPQKLAELTARQRNENPPGTAPGHGVPGANG